MNTDKTLADVQPGGRVRLGDQAERARFEEWAKDRGHDLSVTRDHPILIDGVYEDGDTCSVWAAWQAALSAQPSPGGQGEVTDDMVKAALGPNGWSTYNEEWSSRDRMRAALAAGLAARQPVTMDDALAAGDGTLHGAIDHWQERALRAEAELAVRQPVGEPVAAENPGKRIGMLEAACGPERHFDPAAADAELASIPLVPLWKLPELHPRKVVYECLTTMEYVRQGTKPHSSRRHVLTEAIALAKRFIEQMEANERGGK